MKAWMAAVGMIGLLGACRSPAAPQGSTVQTKVKAETPKAAMAVPEADEDRTVTWKKAPGHPNVRIPSQFTAEQIQKGVVDVEGRGVIVFHSEAQLPNGAKLGMLDTGSGAYVLQPVIYKPSVESYVLAYVSADTFSESRPLREAAVINPGFVQFSFEVGARKTETLRINLPNLDFPSPRRT